MINLGNIKISDLRLGASQVKAVYFVSEQVWGGEEHGTIDDWLCFTAEQDVSTLRLDKIGTPNAISLETSNDEGVTWTDYSWTDSGGDMLILAHVGDKVYIRAKTENINFYTDETLNKILKTISLEKENILLSDMNLVKCILQFDSAKKSNKKRQ